MVRTYLKSNWFLLLTVLILLSLLFSKCEQEKVLNGNLDSFKVQMESYKLKDGRLVNTSKTVTYEKVPEKTELTKKFAKVKTVIKIQERLRIDTVYVSYKDSIPCSFERTGNVVNENYSLDYKSTQKGITIANLSIKDSLEVVTGTKRKWFLGKETHTIDIAHSNKLIETTGLQHVEIKPKKRFYETTLFKIGVGVLIGVSVK